MNDNKKRIKDKVTPKAGYIFYKWVNDKIKEYKDNPEAISLLIDLKQEMKALYDINDGSNLLKNGHI